MDQLARDVRLHDDATFQSYHAGPNIQCVELLRCMRSDVGQHVHLWGGAQTGKTHLLQAACHARTQSGARCVYIPMKELREHDAAILDDLSQLSLVCVDDIDLIAGARHWELAFCQLINGARDASQSILLASRQNPRHLRTVLPDFASRLLWGMVFYLQTLNDEAKVAALHARAAQRGLHLADDAGRYLLAKYPRDLFTLFANLDKLDQASLSAQRRITVPFIKSVLDMDA